MYNSTRSCNTKPILFFNAFVLLFGAAVSVPHSVQLYALNYLLQKNNNFTIKYGEKNDEKKIIVVHNHFAY